LVSRIILHQCMAALRDFSGSDRRTKVRDTYAMRHSEMTVALAAEKSAKWGKLEHGRYTIKEVLDLLNSFVDASDPDVDGSNTIHAFQTAERVRRDFPDDDWLHLTALVHDLGKVISCWGEPQHLVVGDTYVLGCSLPASVVYREYAADNPDASNPRYAGEYGMYEPEVGIDNFVLSWGHDEYMYQVLEGNNSRLPKVCHSIVRYHSFYPWHTGGSYRHLTTREDQVRLLPLVKAFSSYDLYSKEDAIPDVSGLWDSYYSGLCEKYGLGGKLRW